MMPTTKACPAEQTIAIAIAKKTALELCPRAAVCCYMISLVLLSDSDCLSSTDVVSFNTVETSQLVNADSVFSGYATQ